MPKCGHNSSVFISHISHLVSLEQKPVTSRCLWPMYLDYLSNKPQNKQNTEQYFTVFTSHFCTVLLVTFQKVVRIFQKSKQVLKILPIDLFIIHVAESDPTIVLCTISLYKGTGTLLQKLQYCRSSRRS
jgi:hypothetical protein